MKGLTLAIIGCGRIGKMHVENILKNFPAVTIKAVVDSEINQAWTKERNIQHVYSKEEIDKVLQDKEIEAVLIAASSSEHVTLIKKAAAAGKHIFCEKPIAFTPDNIQQAIDAVQQAGVKLQVGFNRRFDPEFSRVKEVVASGAIGKPHVIKITNRDPKRPDTKFIPRSGGLFLDFNVHDFDAARFVTDSEVLEVFAMAAVLVDPKIGELNDVDTAIITLKMESGAYCIIDSSREALYGYDQRLEVFAAEGNIIANNITHTRTRLATADGIVREKPLYSFVERYADAYRLQLGAFFKALELNQPTAVDAQDAKCAVAIAVAANKSIQSNRPVTLGRNQ